MQVLELTKAGSSINFVINAHDQKLGEIVLGRGSLIWKGKHKWTGKHFSWSRFAGIMDGIVSKRNQHAKIQINVPAWRLYLHCSMRVRACTRYDRLGG